MNSFEINEIDKAETPQEAGKYNIFDRFPVYIINFK